MSDFGAKMRALRAEKGVNQADMAAALDVSAAYLSALEHGKKGAPSWPMTQKIIHYFGLIWDDAEELILLAQLSRRRVVVDTGGLDAKASRVANLIAKRIGHLSDDELESLLEILDVENSGDAITR